MAPKFVSDLNLVSDESFLIAPLFDREGHAIRNGERAVATANRLFPERFQTFGRPVGRYRLFVVKTVAMGSTEAGPVWRVRGGRGSSRCMMGLATAFESVEIGPGFLPGQSRRVTSAPFDLEAGETDEEENDEAGVEQRVKGQADCAEKLA